MLAHPNFNESFILVTDASKLGIGGILSQLNNGFERPIAYFSKKLNKAQSNYSATELELFAVVEGIKHFRCYLYGRKFTIITDHRPLKWLINLKDPNSKLARWNLFLSSYDFEIIHREGSSHGNVDALSRCNCIDATVCSCNTRNFTIEKFFTFTEKNDVENKNISLIQGDLFSAPENYSLAHCVS